MVSPTYKSLQSQISQLQKKAQKILAAESKNKNAGIARVLKLMKRLGISAADLQKREAGESGGKKTKRAKSAKSTGKGRRKPVAAKYRDAATGNTWSGRGKSPRWLVAREAEGRKREEFRIP